MTVKEAETWPLQRQCRLWMQKKEKKTNPLPGLSTWQLSELITSYNPSQAHTAPSLKLIVLGHMIPLHFLQSHKEPGTSIFIRRPILTRVLCRESGGYGWVRPWHSREDYRCISAYKSRTVPELTFTQHHPVCLKDTAFIKHCNKKESLISPSVSKMRMDMINFKCQTIEAYWAVWER